MSGSPMVVVGMSGGVDSSVSAYLLKEQGYQVEGLFMKNWDEDDGTEYCTAKTDLEDAEAVCDQLGIELHTANFAAEYWDNVFEHFLEEYRSHRTPNPDVLCNREIKFKVFLEYANELGAELIATGHYARTVRDSGHTCLLKGLDPQKDQSYFLNQVPEQALQRTLFPVGEIHKSEVRQIASKLGLKNKDKKDSTGICFIGERRFADFLRTYIPAQPGDILTWKGDVIGRHQGLMYYTYGQRQGLGIGGVAGYPEQPWYVIEKDIKKNQLVVAQDDHPGLYSPGLQMSNLQMIDGSAAHTSFVCSAKTRYRQPDQACEIKFQPDANRWLVSFKDPQRAVTPGQYLVLYDGEKCLGGGIIEERIA
jgi:tRNA-specific 2-thiouridylase